MLKRGYLMTPGPTPVPPEVEAAMARPIIYHRSSEFQETYSRVLDRLREVVRTSGDLALFTASGSGAMESAVANLCSPGDRVLVVSAGYFGERWVQIAGLYRCDVAHLRYSWGEVPRAEDIESRLAELGGVKAVYFTQSETSTGVVTDVRAIAEKVAEAGALAVVDAISSLGAVPLETDAWGLDVVVSGSQKALMTPPGLALASVSARALDAARATDSPRFYLDWGRTLAAQETGKAPFTPAVSLVRGLDVAVELILEAGLETAWERARRLGRACRAGVKAIGLELFSPDDDSAAVVTAIRMPEGIDGRTIVRVCRERAGVTIAGGQGELSGQVVRIGHVGYVDVEDVAAALTALELALVEAGMDVETGSAARAALEGYAGDRRVRARARLALGTRGLGSFRAPLARFRAIRSKRVEARGGP